MSIRHTLKHLSTFAVLLCVFVGATGCAPSMFGMTAIAPSHVLPEPVTAQNGMKLFWGADVKTEALNLINQSQHYVYLDMYELSDPDILSALATAHARKIDVRVVLDATEQHSVQTGYPALQKAGVPVKFISIKHGIDHLKMLVTDQGVLIGGMNYGSQSWNNNDASVLIPHPNGAFRAVFLWDNDRANGGAEAAPVVPQPLMYDRAIQTNILGAIQSSRKNIAMEAFDLSDQQVTTALVAALNRGVSVAILVDPTQTYSKSSVNKLRDAGAMVRYYRPYENELMHAKILDVDNGTTFIIGSANFSHQAYTYNHEADLILHDVPEFDKALQHDLQTELGRGSDYPIQEKVKSTE